MYENSRVLSIFVVSYRYLTISDVFNRFAENRSGGFDFFFKVDTESSALSVQVSNSGWLVVTVSIQQQRIKYHKKHK